MNNSISFAVSLSFALTGGIDCKIRVEKWSGDFRIINFRFVALPNVKTHVTSAGAPGVELVVVVYKATTSFLEFLPYYSWLATDVIPRCAVMYPLSKLISEHCVSKATELTTPDCVRSIAKARTPRIVYQYQICWCCFRNCLWTRLLS